MSNEENNRLSYDQKVDLIRGGNLFCASTFWIGILGKLQKLIFCKATIFFIFFTLAFWILIDIYTISHWIIYACVGVMFIFTEALIELIKNKISISVEAKLQATASTVANLVGDLNKMAEKFAANVQDGKVTDQLTGGK